MDSIRDFLGRFFNLNLASEPMNWAVVFVIASIWLLAFHVVMTGWGAMTGGGQAAVGSAPGTIAIASNTTSGFSSPGVLSGFSGDNLGTFYGGGITAGDGTWTDGAEAKYAEDGWAANG
jgi:hypothetical protein